MHLSKILDSNVSFGKKSLHQLKDSLHSEDRVLLVTGERSFEISGASQFLDDALKNTIVKQVRYSGKALSVEDVQDRFNDILTFEDINLIIAVGGGSVIDLAKLISFALSSDIEKIDDLIQAKIDIKNHIDLIFVPTTAGTGSEATTFAVLYKNKAKFSVNCRGLKPKQIILDQELLKSLPQKVLHSTILDALSQAIESFWAVQSTKESRIISEYALKIILENINKKNTETGLGSLLIGSYLAGKAINIAKTTASHAISYPLTSYFRIPHGNAVFLSLPSVSRFNYQSDIADIQKPVTQAILRNTFGRLFEHFTVHSIEDFCDNLRSIMYGFGFSGRLRDYTIDINDLKLLAMNSMARGRSDNNPRIITEDNILKILEEIY